MSDAEGAPRQTIGGMDTTTLHGPGEFIAALPGLLGRTPEEEVVVIGLDGRGMVVCAASVDSADLAVPELSPRVAPLLAGDLAARSTTGDGRGGLTPRLASGAPRSMNSCPHWRRRGWSPVRG
ncbi:DUF4192 family protein [Demequina litorisediminis]|uniref:DUF4192 family protein n=1 Tax=Demequina litorisediminis TaxID=1849022 RepID=UPI0024E0D245|nr:DUF4192 family protein [Demequina litorisediminis]